MLVAIDFHSGKKIPLKSMANRLTTNILYYIFICVHQMKDIHEGLEQHMVE